MNNTSSIHLMMYCSTHQNNFFLFTISLSLSLSPQNIIGKLGAKEGQEGERLDGGRHEDCQRALDLNDEMS